jgi:hypothetical protein
MLFIIVLVLVTGWFMSRTDGARKYVEGRLSSRFGQEVSIGRMYIGWPYKLVLADVRTSEFEAAGTEGFSVGDASLSRGIHFWKLAVNEAVVRIKADGKDGWKPARMAELGDLKDARVQDIVRITADMRKKLELRVSSSDISWLENDGVEMAYVRGVDFKMLPLNLDGRQMYYYHLGISRASGLVELNGRNIVREWLTTASDDYIELPGRGGEQPASVDIEPVQPGGTEAVNSAEEESDDN